MIVVLDVKKKLFGGYEVYINNGEKATGINPFKFVEQAQRLGAGEIVINSVDRDGMMKGYDLELAAQVRSVAEVPITFLGGAGSLEDLSDLFSTVGIVGGAAGSLFVFKGKYRAVLISYPTRIQKNMVLHRMTELLNK